MATRLASTKHEAPDVADRLHSAAIHLLRRLRVQDAPSGLTAPRLSALSVVVFGGSRTISDLAGAEQVSVPTMMRLVQAMERDRVVTCKEDPCDRRRVLVRATKRGARLLREGRARRVQALANYFASLDQDDLQCLKRSAELLESFSAL